MLFNPDSYDPTHLDSESRRLLRATIDWFEARGKRRLLSDALDRVWYTEFLDFVRREKLFATFNTPAADAAGDEHKRWDATRNAALSEILGFYGLPYWYTWQVSVLGLGPIWMSENKEARDRAAELLDSGAVFAFGLSEKEHGADVYSTDMILTPSADGGFTATGDKYYIGNGNVAGIVSVFGRRSDVDGPEGYVFFAADSQHEKFSLVQNVVDSQMYVSEFRLDGYPVREQDILHTGPDAFSAALNTVNVGKFNLCTASIGISEHSFYEAITHAHNRILYGKRVTEFPHVRQNFVDAYARLAAMKLFADRSVDYFRSATAEDRRYLLFNPITKMKVTSEGEQVIDLLWDVIAAKGFEKNTYFNQATAHIRALPKLEGTVHVNLALVLKFMPNYLFNPAEYDAVPTRHDAADDEFFFQQGPARGLGKIRFQDWRAVYERFAKIPNVARFLEQADGLKTLLTTAAPDEAQQKDLDFLLNLGQLFTLVVYGQLILEQAELTGSSPDLLDQVFDVLVRDFSGYAVALHGKASATDAQRSWALAHVRGPVVDRERFERLWGEVAELSGRYEMRP
ncbi:MULTISPECIES: acyl-CoA dehydrogenase family protein [unclassified Crossiella]|uniref:acyl-CoA dehydrogenase family protein n=1 Tax=unclassified Crossiella TaxID=2620835 RepID=UPI001FFE8ADE|nr:MULTISPECIES: acyl-CoA dehydrogenase family protein [unclassified Crossiella]MCK2239487.1 acyl-CoA/acyl-ACP dehydrogenase [Crossiella sp. S99.2]MCK2252182.1 acyl-CoA/acyl-ACP dehydrogenase [Crossiella sp. S99.1]